MNKATHLERIFKGLIAIHVCNTTILCFQISSEVLSLSNSLLLNNHSPLDASADLFNCFCVCSIFIFYCLYCEYVYQRVNECWRLFLQIIVHCIVFQWTVYWILDIVKCFGLLSGLVLYRNYYHYPCM